MAVVAGTRVFFTRCSNDGSNSIGRNDQPTQVFLLDDVLSSIELADRGQNVSGFVARISCLAGTHNGEKPAAIAVVSARSSVRHEGEWNDDDAIVGRGIQEQVAVPSLRNLRCLTS